MNGMKLDLGSKGASVGLQVTKCRDVRVRGNFSGSAWPCRESWLSQLSWVHFVVLGLSSKRFLVWLDRINWVILIKPYMGRSTRRLWWSKMENDEPILFWMRPFQFNKYLFLTGFLKSHFSEEEEERLQYVDFKFPVWSSINFSHNAFCR